MKRSEELKLRIKMYESWNNPLGKINKSTAEYELKEIESGNIDDYDISEENELKIRSWVNK